MIRDPLTKEIFVPFETRPNKIDESKDLTWKRAHEDAIKNELEIDKNLKKDGNLEAIIANYNTAIALQESYTVTTEKDYSIANDNDYVHCNNNDMTKELYSDIKKLDFGANANFRQTRHAVIQTANFTKNGKRTRCLGLSDTAGSLNLVDQSYRTRLTSWT